MTELDTIQQTANPHTLFTITQDLQNIGLRRGDTVIVHSAMSKVGWIVGGAETLIDALMKVIAPNGTLVMPTHSSQNSDPSYWENPPVPKDWWPIIRSQMPPYRPEVTPTRGIGTLPELFRRYPNVIRSSHPQFSFAAWGEYAQQITADHAIEVEMGEGSPLAKLYDLDAKVLLIGVTHANNTSLHLAEHRSTYPNKKRIKQGAAVLMAGQRQWIEWESFDYDSDDFEELGHVFETSRGYVTNTIGIAESRLVSQRAIIDFGAGWLSAKRSTPSNPSIPSQPSPAEPEPNEDAESDAQIKTKPSNPTMQFTPNE